eukprot:gene4563-5584_t
MTDALVSTLFGVQLTALDGPVKRANLAAMMVQDAQEGVFREELEYPANVRGRLLYVLHSRLRYVRLLALATLICLYCYQTPAWCSNFEPFPGAIHVGGCSFERSSTLTATEASGAGAPPAEEPMIPVSGVALATGTRLTLESFGLAVLAFDSLLEFSVTGPTSGARFRLASLALLCGNLMLDMTFTPPWSLSPYLHVALVGLYDHTIANSFRRTLLHILPALLEVLSTLVAFLVCAAWLGAALFGDLEAGKESFGSFGEALYNMFITLTGANYPDIKQALFAYSRWTYLYFLGFLLVGVFLFMNLVLATVYNVYTDRLKADTLHFHRMAGMIWGMAGSDGLVDFEELGAMLSSLGETGSVSAVVRQRIDVYFAALDRYRSPRHSVLLAHPNASGRARMCIKVRVNMRKYKLRARGLPSARHLCRGAGLRPLVAAAVTHPHFEKLVDAVLVLNGLVILYESSQDIKNNETAASTAMWGAVEISFALLYLAEMSAK